MKTVLEIFETEAENASKTKLGYIGYLSNLIEQEFLVKTDRSINRKIQTAKFPSLKTIFRCQCFHRRIIHKYL